MAVGEAWRLVISNEEDSLPGHSGKEKEQNGRHKSNYHIITFNVNGLNYQIKRQILSDWMKKQDLTIRCLQETHFRFKDTTDRLK